VAKTQWRNNHTNPGSHDAILHWTIVCSAEMELKAAKKLSASEQKSFFHARLLRRWPEVSLGSSEEAVPRGGRAD